MTSFIDQILEVTTQGLEASQEYVKSLLGIFGDGDMPDHVEEFEGDETGSMSSASSSVSNASSNMSNAAKSGDSSESTANLPVAKGSLFEGGTFGSSVPRVCTICRSTSCPGEGPVNGRLCCCGCKHKGLRRLATDEDTRRLQTVALNWSTSTRNNIFLAAVHNSKDSEWRNLAEEEREKIRVDPDYRKTFFRSGLATKASRNLFLADAHFPPRIASDASTCSTSATPGLQRKRSKSSHEAQVPCALFVHKRGGDMVRVDSLVTTSAMTPATPKQTKVSMALDFLDELKETNEELFTAEQLAAMTGHMRALDSYEKCKEEETRQLTIELGVLRKSEKEKMTLIWRKIGTTDPTAVSPSVRFEHVEKNDTYCRALFVFSGPALRKLVDWSDMNGAWTKTPLYTATGVRRLLQDTTARATEEAAAATVLASSLLQSNSSSSSSPASSSSSSSSPITVLSPPPITANSGRRRLFDPYNMCAMAMFILSHASATCDFTKFIFGVASDATITSYFSTGIVILHDFLTTVCFPPMDHERAELCNPISVATKLGANQVTFAIDAEESKRRTASSGRLHACFFSDYKKSSTLKYLVIVNLAGFCVWVSDAYPGKTSDNKIIAAEWKNMLPYLPRGSIIFVDKGFLEGPLATRLTDAGLHLRIPPRKKDNSVMMETHNVVETKEIANLRIVVECFIRLASAKFPWIRAPHDMVQDDIVSLATRVAFLLCNFLRPCSQSDTSVKDVSYRKRRKGNDAEVAATWGAQVSGGTNLDGEPHYAENWSSDDE
jgi:hypothetical protein